MSRQTPIKLVLENGMTFSGISFGAQISSAGEVVFNTAMTGYPESLTDPSYAGQILVSTYPLVGNYGVPGFDRENMLLKNFESNKIAVRGLVISDYSVEFSHWNARQSLGQWLASQNIPGIYGLDTRHLTRILREHGTMLGKIISGNDDVTFFDPSLGNIVDLVSVDKPETYGDGKYRIALVDCGVKNNIIRCFLERDVTVVRLPWDYDYNEENFDGIFISNGPGDPKQCIASIEHLTRAIEGNVPVFGICLGSQLLALAAGADTYKLKYGHRSHNQPVQLVGTDKCYITSQNHGYAVDEKSLSSNWEPFFVNVNDGTLEGIRHKRKPFFATQFHPEASGGPTDTEFLIDDFVKMIKDSNK